MITYPGARFAPPSFFENPFSSFAGLASWLRDLRASVFICGSISGFRSFNCASSYKFLIGGFNSANDLGSNGK
jgi:hypothetical protein